MKNASDEICAFIAPQNERDPVLKNGMVVVMSRAFTLGISVVCKTPALRSVPLEYTRRKIEIKAAQISGTIFLR